MKFDELKIKTPTEIRECIRKEEWTGPTTGIALGFVQANLVIVPEKLALDFILFCQRNHSACPILEFTEPGAVNLNYLAKDVDLRTDLPKYRVYERGILIDEPLNIVDYWRPDFVSFLIGCSLSFEKALTDSNIPLRHLENNKNGAIYISSIKCNPAGKFRGNMAVSLRPIPREKLIRTIQITSRFYNTHGAPIHIGDPALIGIKNLDKVDYGDPPIFKDNDVPVFWACGVTPQVVALESKPGIMITHSPTHMFVSDIKDTEIAIF